MGLGGARSGGDRTPIHHRRSIHSHTPVISPRRQPFCQGVKLRSFTLPSIMLICLADSTPRWTRKIKEKGGYLFPPQLLRPRNSWHQSARRFFKRRQRPVLHVSNQSTDVGTGAHLESPSRPPSIRVIISSRLPRSRSIKPRPSLSKRFDL